MGDAAGHQQAAVFEFLLDLLCADELAALEISGGLARYLQHDFGLVQVEPDTVFALQLLLDVGGALETFVGHQQPLDLGEREGLDALAVEHGQIPDAAVVDEAVGLQARVVLAAFVAGFGVGEADAALILDRTLDLAEGERLRRVQLLEVRALDDQRRIGRLVDQAAHEVAAQLRVELADAGQPGEAFDLVEREGAELALRQPVAALFGALQVQALEAHAQIALDGAPAHAEFGGEGAGIEFPAFVERDQDGRQATSQLDGVVGGWHAGR